MLQIQVPNSRAVKSTARAILKGRYITAGIAGIIPYFIYLFIAAVTGILSMLLRHYDLVAVALVVLFGIFLFAPVLLGAVRWFWRLTDDCEDSPPEVFYYFSSFFLYKRALKSILFLAFKCFTAIFTCLIPYLVVSVLSNSWIYQFLGAEIPLWVAGLALVQSFLRIVGILSAFTVISRYYLFPALVVMDEDMLLLEAMHISVMVSRRSVSAFIALALSLVGFVILSFFALPLFYTAPLFFTVYAVHSRYALVNYNQNLDRFKKEQFVF